MNKQLFIILIIYTSTSSLKCIKERFADKLPEPTQDGRNTFGCYVNGILFITGETLFGNVNPTSCVYYSQAINNIPAGNVPGGTLIIQGIGITSEISGNIIIQKTGVFSPGTYSLVSDICQYPNRCDAAVYYSTRELSYNSSQGIHYVSKDGQLVITKLDTINKIVSGMFKFIAADSTGKTRIISDGRFDMKIEN